MSDSRAEEVLKRQSRMEADRGVFEGHWEEVAERVLPRQRDFNQKRAGGEKLQEKVFDSTAPLALERFAAAMESMLTPRTQRWHELKAPEGEGNSEIDSYLHEVTSILFRARYAPTANFASQLHETYMGLGAFGTGAVFIDDALGAGLRYISCSLAETYIAENYIGVVDTVHRKFERSARQLAQRFGEEKLPNAIRRALENEPDKLFEVIHCFKPREDAKWDKANYEGMPWASYYVSQEGRAVLGEGGYRSFRYAVSRYVTAPREVYGRSPAMTVLADIKTANEQAKTLLRTGQLAADPPLLLSDEGSLSTFRTRPGSLNWGGLDEAGNPRAVPLESGKNLPITLEMQQETRKVINDAFLVSLFQILVDQPNMTATEAMLRAQEKGALLAPTMGRQQSEMLGPLIMAEIDILSQAGVIPPPPDGLEEYDIEYVSPLNRAQRADEGVGILRTFETLTPLAEIDPKVMRIFKLDDVARELADINGVPPKLLYSKEEMAEIEAADAQAAQMESLLAAAPVAADAAKTMAETQALTGAGTGQAPLLLPAA